MGLLDFLKMPRSDNPDRKASLQGRSQLYNLLDNIIGFEDDRVTPGEALGAGLRQDPMGVLGGVAQGVESDLRNLMFEGGAMQRPADVLGYAAAPMAPGARGLLSRSPDVMYSNPAMQPFDIKRSDASQIFGTGTERVRYTDPTTGGTMEVVARPDGSASVLELEVPEASRGKGVGQKLQAQVLQDYPKMSGQVSSKAAAKTAYRLGRRPYGQPDATLDDVFAIMDDMSSVNLVSPKMQPSLAQDVAGLLSTGRANEVTDEMLDKFTPKDEMELFDLYQRGATGMDLPMGEASRMARAGEIGHNVDREFYRGGGSDRKSLSADAGTFKTQNTGVFMDPNPMRAETYAKQGGGVVAPLLSRSDAPIVFGDMSEWNRLEAPSYAYDPVRDSDVPLIEQIGTTTTDDIARAARQQNLEAIEIQDVMDPGPMRWRNEDKSIREYPQFGTTRVEFDPANIRSRFARFDPRLAHLRNLSAGVGGLGLLGMSYPQEDQY